MDGHVGRHHRTAAHVSKAMTRIALATLAAVLFLATAARADDFGPKRGIREVREAVPVLMAALVRSMRVPFPIDVDSVVVANDGAVATWHAGSFGGLTILDYRLARWWLRETHILPLCDDDRGDLRIADPLAADVKEHLDLKRRRCDDVADLLQPPIWANVDGTDHYEAFLAPPGSDDLGPQPPSGFRGRAPTDGEMTGPGANAIYFFSRDVGAQGVAYPAHTTLDIWCPFVLDSEVRYSLTIVGGDAIVGPLDGTMSDNTMHFDLPAFSAQPGAELRGEIDWLTRHRS